MTTTALFPGAFRPPHQAHHAAIAWLAARDDVDEVVVIVANRCRTLPGTTLALDADVACRVLAIYTEGMPKVRVEKAAHNAVAHALAWAKRAGSATTLLCLGEADARSGDDRFDHGGDARVLRLPTAAIETRATELRAALVRGEDGRAAFAAGLPDHLSARQVDAVWRLCREGLRDFADIVAPKVRALVEPVLGPASDWRCERRGKLDPVFSAGFAGHAKRLFVKYAGETSEAGTLGNVFAPKPRRRLGAERRAIRRLRDSGIPIRTAQVVHFDKALDLLVTDEVFPGGESLFEQWQRGCFDVDTAASVGRFLVACHALGDSQTPLWGERENDLRHWRRMLGLLTTAQAGRHPAFADALSSLAARSDAVRRAGFFVLDPAPKNIRLERGGSRSTTGDIGMIDLESCSGIGDPAYDVGIVLGHAAMAGDRARPAFDAIIHGYGRAVFAAMRSRALPFAAATILHAGGDVRIAARWLLADAVADASP